MITAEEAYKLTMKAREQKISKVTELYMPELANNIKAAALQGLFFCDLPKISGYDDREHFISALGSLGYTVRLSFTGLDHVVQWNSPYV